MNFKETKCPKLHVRVFCSTEKFHRSGLWHTLYEAGRFKILEGNESLALFFCFAMWTDTSYYFGFELKVHVNITISEAHILFTSRFIPEGTLRRTRYSDYLMVFQNIWIFPLEVYSKQAGS